MTNMLLEKYRVVLGIKLSIGLSDDKSLHIEDAISDDLKSMLKDMNKKDKEKVLSEIGESAFRIFHFEVSKNIPRGKFVQ